MKNIIVTLFAVFVSANAFAFASPSQEARTKDYLAVAKDMDTMASACSYKKRYDLLDAMMAKAYAHAGATDSMQQKIVDMWYMNAPQDAQLRRMAVYFKANKNSASVKKECASVFVQLDDFLAELS